MINRNPEIIDHIHKLKAMSLGNPKATEFLINDFSEKLIKKIVQEDPEFIDGILFYNQLEEAFLTDKSEQYAKINFIVDLNSGWHSNIVDRVYFRGMPQPPQDELGFL